MAMDMNKYQKKALKRAISYFVDLQSVYRGSYRFKIINMMSLFGWFPKVTSSFYRTRRSKTSFENNHLTKSKQKRLNKFTYPRR